MCFDDFHPHKHKDKFEFMKVPNWPLDPLGGVTPGLYQAHPMTVMYYIFKESQIFFCLVIVNLVLLLTSFSFVCSHHTILKVFPVLLHKFYSFSVLNMCAFAIVAKTRHVLVSYLSF